MELNENYLWKSSILNENPRMLYTQLQFGVNKVGMLHASSLQDPCSQIVTREPTLRVTDVFSESQNALWQQFLHLVVSLNKGDPQYRPLHTIILIIGTPKKVPLISGSPHFLLERSYRGYSYHSS